VTELAGVPVGAPEQLAADDDAGPDPDLAGDVDVVAQAGPVPEPQLAQRGHVGLVLDQDRAERGRHPPGQQPAQGDPVPVEVGARATVPVAWSTSPGTATQVAEMRRPWVLATAAGSRARLSPTSTNWTRVRRARSTTQAAR